MLLDEVKSGLLHRFNTKNIVFWYDDEGDLRDLYDQVGLPGVEKVVIDNNEFGIKFKILSAPEDSKFLVYKQGPRPTDANNWLLDIELANVEYRTDQEALWLSEMGLDYQHADLIKKHIEFFKAEKRREGLKGLLTKNENSATIRTKLLAVCTACDPDLDEVVRSLIEEVAQQRQEKDALVKRCALDEFLFEKINLFYGYKSSAPSIKDFVYEMFHSSYEIGLGNKGKLKHDADVFLRQWKDSKKYSTAFETLSAEIETNQGIAGLISSMDIQQLINIDFFRVIDLQIIATLVTAIENDTLGYGQCAQIVKQRELSFWYSGLESEYKAIERSAALFELIKHQNLTVSGFDEGLRNYAETWHQVDRVYREAIFHIKQSKLPDLREQLKSKVEGQYSNNYLLKINDAWQSYVDHQEKWVSETIVSQRSFFEKKVKPRLSDGKKVCVIISDALRYEAGMELRSRILSEDKYQATIEPALSVLPSYTQLGMAALLPHKDLEISDDSRVLVDGNPADGTANREKILKRGAGEAAFAIQAQKFMAGPSGEMKERFAESQVAYIYHDLIDKMGDSAGTEENTFKAVSETMDELLRLIKRVVSVSPVKICIYVTADHGFLYQDKPLETSEFTRLEDVGGEQVFNNRRFVLGRNMNEVPNLRLFSAKQLGLSGDLQVGIPKSINRIRKPGGGSRFVHGGSTLQEIVIPIIEITKKKISDIGHVNIEILRRGSDVITSGQFAASFYQVDPVSDKVLPRKVRAVVCNAEGDEISDSKELRFEFQSEMSREREMTVQFVLSSRSDKISGEKVKLCLFETIEGTNKEKEYISMPYTVRRAFMSDFD